MTADIRTHLQRRLVESGVPDHLHEGLTEYIVTGRPVGQFLTAVLTNDLKDACVRADVASRPALFAIVSFLFNYAPAPCWGSRANVEAWLADSEPRVVGFE